ncbi:MAG: AAA family ATPase, partial [Actinomycetia bacterium]|nr:AAA family ATPase [Actinomycetes bacterium]
MTTPIGRESEADVLDRFLHELARGQGGALLLEGEGGVGKSTLADWATSRSEALDIEVVRGLGFELARDTPYAPLVAALETAVNDVDLTKGLPALSLLFDRLPATAAPADPELSRTRLQVALVTIAHRLGRDRPVLFICDDLHWFDAASLGVIAALTVDLVSSGVGLIACYRTFESGGRPEVSSALSALRRVDGAVHIRMDRLDRAATDRLVAERLGGFIPKGVSDTIWERSAGNPLFAEAILDDLLASGALGKVDGRWRLAEDQVSIPQLVDDLLGERVRHLDESARIVMGALSLAGGPLAETVLAVVDGLDTVERARALRTLRDCHLAAVEDRKPATWRPAHPLAAAVTLATMTDSERAEMHQRFIRALSHESALRRAPHVLASGAGPTSSTVELLVEAGEEALAQGALAEAVRVLGPAREMIDSGGAPHLRGPVLAGLGEAWARREESAVAISLLDEAFVAFSDDGDRAGQIRVLRSLSPLSFLAGSGPRLAETERLVADAEAAGSQSDLIEAVFLEATVSNRDSRPVAGHIARLEEAVGRIAVEDPARGRAELIVEVTRRVHDHEHSDTPSLETYRSLQALANRCAPEPDLRSRVLLGLVDCALAIGDAGLVASAATVASEGRGIWAGHSTWRAIVVRWALAVGRGDLLTATKLDAAPWMGGSDRGLVLTLVLEALGHWLRGDELRSAEVLSGAAPLAQGQDRVAQLYLAVANGVTGEGDSSLLANEALPLWHTSAGFMGMMVLAAGKVRAKEMSATEVLAWADRLIDRYPAGAWAAWADVVAASAMDDGGAAAKRLVRAARLFDGLGSPFLGARQWVTAAELARDSVANDRLQHVTLFLSDVGGPWADRAIALVTARQLSMTPSATESDPLGLTAREREVAREVADGLTNREIAERLFISIRTVTSHLDHIYTKL